MKKKTLVTLFFTGLLYVDATFAGPDLIDFPENYQAHMIRYDVVDKPEGTEPAKVRWLYVNREALVDAQPDQPLPNGTVLVMEDRSVQLDQAGKPVKDTQGRFIATDEILAVIVQKKKAGWGQEYPEELRNGEWEYAFFNADQSRRKTQYEGCFGCHKGQSHNDYNFTFSPFIKTVK